MIVIILRFLFPSERERGITTFGFSAGTRAASLFSYTQEQLVSIVEQQQEKIQSLTNETSWLQQDNSIQRSQVIECYEKAVEWQQYAGDSKKELEHLKNRDDKWREGIIKAVEQRNEVEKTTAISKSYILL